MNLRRQGLENGLRPLQAVCLAAVSFHRRFGAGRDEQLCKFRWCDILAMQSRNIDMQA